MLLLQVTAIFLINQCLHFPEYSFQARKQNSTLHPRVCVWHFQVTSLECQIMPLIFPQSDSLAQKDLEFYLWFNEL